MRNLLCGIVSAMMLIVSYAHGEMLEDEIGQTSISWTTDGEGGWRKQFVIDDFLFTNAIVFYEKGDEHDTYIIKHKCSMAETFEIITWNRGDTVATKIDCDGIEGKVRTASMFEKIIGVPP